MLKQTTSLRIASLFVVGCLVGAPIVGGAAFAATGVAEKSESYLREAQTYLEKGEVNAAIIELKNALQEDPNNIAARRLLGELYLKAGNGPYAEKEFRAVVRRGGDEKAVRLMLAEAYLLQAKYSEVLTDLEDDNSDPALRARTLLARGRAYLGLRRSEQAQASFVEAEHLEPGLPAAKIAIARSLVMQRKVDEAEIKIDEAIAIDPKNPDALVMKAELRRIAHDLEGALTQFAKAIAARPNNPPARLGRAASLIDLNRLDEAKEDVEAVFAVAPRHPLASYLMALILAKQSDYAGARDALQQGGAALQNHLPSIFLTGAVSYSLNQLEQAVHSLTRYIEAVPGNITAIKLLAAALVRSNEPKKAIALLEPYLEKGTSDPQILTLAASAYMRVGEHTKGAELFEKAAEASPETASIRTQLALSRLALGQSDRAVGDLEAAVNLDPDQTRAPVLLTLVQLRSRKFDDALKSIEGLREKMPGTPLPDNLAGAAYLGKGDLVKAREAFENALKINPDFHPARMNVAQIDLREKKIKAAIAQYERIVEKSPKHLGAMLALSAIAQSENRSDDEFAWLRRAIDANPAAIAPQLRMIQYFGRNRELQKAVAAARDLEQTNPNDPRVLEVLGRSEMAVRDFLAAVTTFRKLVRLLPKSPPAFGLLAGAQQAAKNVEAARQSLRNAIALDDSYLAAHLALAALETQAGRTDEAKKVAEHVMQKYPDSAVGYMMYGDIHMQLAQYDLALKAYGSGLEKEDIPTMALRRFNAQRRSGHDAEAFAFLQGWVDRKGDVSLRHFLATAYIAARRYDDAIRESEKLFADDAKNPVLLNNLAWLYDQKNDERALEFAENALKQAPDAPAIMDTAGWILLHKGDLERAAKLLAKASEIAPNNGDIGYHYAVALHRTGHPHDARRKLKKLLGSGIRFSESDNAEALLKQLGG